MKLTKWLDRKLFGELPAVDHNNATHIARRPRVEWEDTPHQPVTVISPEEPLLEGPYQGEIEALPLSPTRGIYQVEKIPEWNTVPGKIWSHTVPEVILHNPKPLRGAVAKNVQKKMIREGVTQSLHLLDQGAKEQAFSQLWSNFVNMCYATGIDVDTNADLRMYG